MFVVADVAVDQSATPDQRDYYRSVATITQRDPHPRLGGGIDREVTIANAHRIVACVNACAGIPTETLECPGGNIAKVAGSLLKQRNKLLAALEEAEKHMVEDWHLIDSDRGPLSTTVDEEPVIAMVRAVIAEAKGESK